MSSFVNFLISAWYEKVPNSNYYKSKKNSHKFLLREILLSLWAFPLVILSFGFEKSKNKYIDNLKGFFLVLFYVVFIIYFLEK